MRIKIPDELKAAAPQTTWGKILTASPVVMAVLATMLAGLASSEMTRAQYDRSFAAQQQSKAGDQWSFFQAKRLRGAMQRNTLEMMDTLADIRPLNLAALKHSVEQFPTELESVSNQIRDMHERPPSGSPGAANSSVVPKAAEQFLEDATRRKTEAEALKSDVLALMESAEGGKALDFMQRSALPETGDAPALETNLKVALDALESSKGENEIAPLVAAVDDNVLDEALRMAKDRTQALEEATKPVNAVIDRLALLLGRQTALLQEARSVLLLGGAVLPAGPSPNRDFTAARLRYAATRYDGEARLNQAIASLYELKVRKNNLSAERHHRRSQRFFYGMLGAQLAVIISTFAIAARMRNLLWSLAASAGLAAIAFGAYVYLYV